MKNLLENTLLKELYFNNEIKQLLIQGGQIVESRIGINKLNKPHFVGVIRMPKGKWIADTRKGELFENNKFEYVMIENLWHDDKFDHDPNAHNKIIILGKYNDHIRGIKRDTISRFHETRHTY